MLLLSFIVFQAALASSNLVRHLHIFPVYHLILYPALTKGFPSSSISELKIIGTKPPTLGETAVQLSTVSLLKQQLGYNNEGPIYTPAFTSYGLPIMGSTSIGTASSWSGGYSRPGTNGITPPIPTSANAQASATAGGVTYSSSSSSGTSAQTGNVGALSNSQYYSTGSNRPQNPPLGPSSSSNVGSNAGSSSLSGTGSYPTQLYQYGSFYPQTSVNASNNSAAGSAYSPGYYQKPQHSGGYSATGYQYNKPYSTSTSGSGSTATYYNPNRPVWPTSGVAGTGTVSAASSSSYNQNKPGWPTSGIYTNTGTALGSSTPLAQQNRPVLPTAGPGTATVSPGYYNGYYYPQGTGTYTNSYYNRPTASTVGTTMGSTSVGGSGYNPASSSYSGSSATAQGGYYNGYYKPTSLVSSGASSGLTTQTGGTYSGYYNPSMSINTGTYSGYHWPTTSGSKPNYGYGGSTVIPSTSTAGVVTTGTSVASSNNSKKPWWLGNSIFGTVVNPVSTAISNTGSHWWLSGTSTGTGSGSSSFISSGSGFGALSGQQTTNIAGPYSGSTSGAGTWAGNYGETSANSGTKPIYTTSTILPPGSTSNSISAGGSLSGTGSITGQIGSTSGATIGGGTILGTVGNAGPAEGTGLVLGTSTGTETAYTGPLTPIIGVASTGSTTETGARPESIGSISGLFTGTVGAAGTGSVGSVSTGTMPPLNQTVVAAGMGSSTQSIISSSTPSGEIDISVSSGGYSSSTSAASATESSTVTSTAGTGESSGSVGSSGTGIGLTETTGETGSFAGPIAIVSQIPGEIPSSESTYSGVSISPVDLSAVGSLTGTIGSGGPMGPTLGTTTASVEGSLIGQGGVSLPSGLTSETPTGSESVQTGDVTSETSIGSGTMGGASISTSGSSSSIMETGLLAGTEGIHIEPVSGGENSIAESMGNTTSELSSLSGGMVEPSSSSTPTVGTSYSAASSGSDGINSGIQASHFVTSSNVSEESSISSGSVSQISDVYPGTASSLTLNATEGISEPFALNEAGGCVSSNFLNKPSTSEEISSTGTPTSSVSGASSSNNFGSSSFNGAMSSSSTDNHGESYSVQTGSGVNEHLAGSSGSALGSTFGGISENAANAGSLISGIINMVGAGAVATINIPFNQGPFAMSSSEAGISAAGIEGTSGSHTGVEDLTAGISGSGAEASSQSLSSSSSGSSIETAGEPSDGFNGSPPLIQNILNNILGGVTPGFGFPK